MFELNKIEILKGSISELSIYETEAKTSSIDVDDDITKDFIKNSIYNFKNSDKLKNGELIENELFEQYKNNATLEEFYKTLTQNITHKYFEILQCNSRVPSAEIITLLMSADNTNYLAVFKYTHKTMLVADKMQEEIKINKKSSLFVSKNHKADEGFIIELNNYTLEVIDHKYEVNGDKEYIFKDLILGATTQYSQAEKLEIFTKVTKNLNDKYIQEDIDKISKIKQAVKNIVLEKRFLNINDFLDRAFEHDEELRKIYKATLLKSGLKEIDEINIPDNVLKKYLRQKLITETGIEITIPIDYLNDSSLFNVKVEHSGAIVATIQSNVLINKE